MAARETDSLRYHNNRGTLFIFINYLGIPFGIIGELDSVDPVLFPYLLDGLPENHKLLPDRFIRHQRFLKSNQLLLTNSWRNCGPFFMLIMPVIVFRDSGF